MDEPLAIPQTTLSLFFSPPGHMHTCVLTHDVRHVQATLHHVLLHENGNVQRCVEQL